MVTGAGAGIGSVFAAALCADGVEVVVADVDLNAAARVCDVLRAGGGFSTAIWVDVADDESVAEMADVVVARHGGIDILVNNAGRHLHTFAQPCSAIDIALWRDLFSVNLTGTLLMTRACLAGLRARPRSSVVNISSAGGVTTPTSAYGVSKSAVIALTVALAAELGPEGIRVNAIAPGMVDSPAAMAELDADFQARIVAQQRLKRPGRMDDLVGALRYLTSDAASFVTGQTLVVDGGMRMRV